MPVVKLDLDNAQYLVKLAEAARQEEKHEELLRKKGRAAKQSAKEQVDAVDSLIRELKIEKDIENQIADDRKRKLTTFKSDLAEAAVKSRELTKSLSAPVQIDSWAKGMERIGTEAAKANLKIRELAQAMSRAFMSGGPGGLSAAPGRDSWFEGMQRLKAENAGRSAEATAAMRAFMSGQGGLSAAPVRNAWGEGMVNIEAGNRASMVSRLRAAMSPVDYGDFGGRVKRERAIRADIARVEAEQSKIVNAELVNTTSGLSGLGRELLSFASITSVASQAISNAKEMMRFGAEQREGGAASLKGDFDVYREIHEVSTPGTGQAAKRIEQYKRLREVYGLDRESAWNTMEPAIASGNEAAIERFARTQGVMRPETAMRVGSRLETIFRDSTTPINEIQAANMMLKASQQAFYKIEQFAPSLPTAAIGGTQGGSSAAETLAIQSVMSDIMKDPEQSADRLAYIGTRGKYMPGLKSAGKGVMAMVEELHGLDPETRGGSEFAGKRVELNAFIDKVYQNRERIAQRTREIQAEQDRAMGQGSMLERGQRDFSRHPDTRVLLDNRLAAQEEEATLRNEYGRGQTEVESTRRRMRIRGINGGQSVPYRWLENKAAGAMEEAGFGAKSIEVGAPVAAESFIGSALRTLAGPSIELLRGIYSTLQSIDGKAGGGKPPPSVSGGRTGGAR